MKLIYVYLFFRKGQVDGIDQKGGMASTCPKDLRHPKVAQSVLGLQHSFLHSSHHHNHRAAFSTWGFLGPSPDLSESEFPTKFQSKTLTESEESICLGHAGRL